MFCKYLSSTIVIGCLLMVVIGCQTAPDPQRIGVFASTNRGLLELSSYGEQTGMTSYSLLKLSEVPKASKVEQFYVNMPGSTITELKVFWITKFDNEFDEKDRIPLNASIEAGKSNVYRIRCADLAGKKDGYAFLKLPMPLGVADRMYVIRLSE